MRLLQQKAQPLEFTVGRSFKNINDLRGWVEHNYFLHRRKIPARKRAWQSRPELDGQLNVLKAVFAK